MAPGLAVERAIERDRPARERRARGLAALRNQRTQHGGETLGPPLGGRTCDMVRGPGERADDPPQDGGGRHFLRDSSFSTFFCTLPMALRGSSATKWTCLGTLKFASFAL